MVDCPFEKITLVQLVEKFPDFYEPEVSLPCSKEPATGTYLEVDESIPHVYI
jgi:hypothetical protein